MSRVGRKPIAVPEKVKVTVKERHVTVEGPLGKLDAIIPEGVTVKVDKNVINVGAPEAARNNRGYQGLMRALLANMVHGVLHGYERTLEITGVGYKAELKGDTVTFALGYSHLIHLKLPKTIKAVIDKSQTKVTIKGIDKQLVYQIAAQIRSYKKPEPYKGKGVKYAGENIRRKAGKAGAK
jgi:large subunit ribosomal protein L6